MQPARARKAARPDRASPGTASSIPVLAARTESIEKLYSYSAFVVRERSADDGRVVLASISPEGREQVGASRIQVQALLRGTVARLSDGELAGLVAASETMGRMIEMLQQRTSRS